MSTAAWFVFGLEGKFIRPVFSCRSTYDKRPIIIDFYIYEQDVFADSGYFSLVEHEQVLFYPQLIGFTVFTRTWQNIVNGMAYRPYKTFIVLNSSDSLHEIYPIHKNAHSY